MKNPLIKRLPRELRTEFGKYAVIFILMTLTIGLISGYLVADGSMIKAYNESFEKYKIEDGKFIAQMRLTNGAFKYIEEEGNVRLYENFFVEETLENENTMRIFPNRTEVDLVCLMQGRMPEEKWEIAIDRMHADNNDLKIGDVIRTAGSEKAYTITGLVALSDYSCLFADNSDSMFDAIRFGVAVVTEETFSTYSDKEIHWNYAWTYNNPPAEEREERDMSEELLKVVNHAASLLDYVPLYINQAIIFTGDDMSSDGAMMLTLLYIIIVIMAFVFGVTMSNTIEKEAAVIGTLRASGYTVGEMIRHYMAMPMIVVLIAALVGNILGYTVMKEFAAFLYYNSYSLTTYVTIWSGEAFLLTTVVPIAIMMLIDFIFLRRALTLSPLKFIRRDLTRRKAKRALPLPGILRFFTRFRMRVLMQNAGSYLVLFIGICFVNLLLIFGLALPQVIRQYERKLSDNLFTNYQYMLEVPVDAVDEDHKLLSFINMMSFSSDVETENPDAEKFSVTALETYQVRSKPESVLVYGVNADSRYVKLPELADGEVFISSAYADKYQARVGDDITLAEKYEDTLHTFRIAGIYDYMGALAVFMEREKMNTLFDLGKSYFCGYFSETPITDINEKYIGSVIDLEALTKISRQLDHSMGGFMQLINVFAVLIFITVVYLLSKIIIEKNAQAISLAKILGYTDREIGKLYVNATTVVVVGSIFLSLPLISGALGVIFRLMMVEMLSGWLPLDVPRRVYVECVLYGLVTYAVVSVIEIRKIKKIPMEEALKHVE